MSILWSKLRSTPSTYETIANLFADVLSLKGVRLDLFSVRRNDQNVLLVP